ncbi:MAG: tRNA (adenosine(37)-N6)-threonylcarbamoyltransferase complex dimerization subunit type 1 TsaB [Candidatus Eisenbacteria bacterium]|nr:tRNA (adenosine(37)-N6)-threonylcarbamoyltransferase complex dimerization subunit type 1 TsaB [Candidatus Eisenbacteria bacterium]
MRVLTIETSTPVEDVAVVEGGEVLAARRLAAGRGRAEELIIAIAETLRESGTDLRALDAIGVSIGPGRFTGLRVGLATAKGLSAVSGVPVRPVPTLEALARSARDEGELVGAALDARRGEVYGALFVLGRAPRRLLDDAAEPPDAFAARVAGAAAGKPVLLVGTGAVAYRDELMRALGDAARFPSEELQRPSARAIAAMVEGASAAPPPDLDALEPIYLRGV